MTDTPESLPPLPQRWTTGDASTSEAGGFVAYSDYLELRRAALAQRQQVPGTATGESNGRRDGFRPSLHGGVAVGGNSDRAVAGGNVPSLTDRLWNSEEVMSLNAELGLTMDQLVRLLRAAAPALTAAPRAQAEPVEKHQSEFIALVRKAVAASKAAPVGTAVPLPPSLTAEFRKFMRDEPSAFDSIAWGEFKALAGATPPTAQAEPQGELCIVKNEAGQIVAVTRCVTDGRILETIAESAQAEPVRQRACASCGALKCCCAHRQLSAQAELRIVECPSCGMEFVDGALHNANLELHRLRNAAQAEPQEPISDGLVSVAISVRDVHPESFARGVRFAEDFHGIGKQEKL